MATSLVASLVASPAKRLAKPEKLPALAPNVVSAIARLVSIRRKRSAKLYAAWARERDAALPAIIENARVAAKLTHSPNGVHASMSWRNAQIFYAEQHPPPADGIDIRIGLPIRYRPTWLMGKTRHPAVVETADCCSNIRTPRAREINAGGKKFNVDPGYGPHCRGVAHARGLVEKRLRRAHVPADVEELIALAAKYLAGDVPATVVQTVAALRTLCAMDSIGGFE